MSTCVVNSCDSIISETRCNTDIVSTKANIIGTIEEESPEESYGHIHQDEGKCNDFDDKFESADFITSNFDGESVENNHFEVLNYEWVNRLNQVMESFLSISSRQRDAPTLEVQLKELVILVRSRLQDEGVVVRDVRLNGGAATYIIGNGDETNYSDVDLIFGVDLSGGANAFQKVKVAVLDCLTQFLPTEQNSLSHHTTESFFKEAYVQKMVRVNNSPSDIWSLIALGNQAKGGKRVELKFVDRMRRKYEFTVDSFQIILDSLLTYYEVATQPINPQLYPTVAVEAVSGNFKEAYQHFTSKLISTRNPEEIRGGGLLKYCKLLVEGYRPAHDIDITVMERYMCSRFFIDFPDLTRQQKKLESYLVDHFSEHDELKADYLATLYRVVYHSTVCLMNHERRQTLYLIDILINQVMKDIELKQSVVHLEEFSSQNWVLDQVFYGTSYFPFAYMSASPLSCNQVTYTAGNVTTTSQISAATHGEAGNNTVTCVAPVYASSSGPLSCA